MQIKFNKIVRPVSVKPEESRSARQETVIRQEAVNQEVNQETVIPAQNPEQEQSSQAAQMESFVAEVTKQSDNMPAVEIPETEIKTENSRFAEQPVNSAVQAAGISNIEETLKKFIGKTIRVYTADHENVSGRLESIKDGWIKICNARSAGGGYYCDEDIINIRNIVRLRFIRNITKSDYVEFTNADN
ncbi:MAG: hypothetical protein K2J37_01675 [Ruminococcus sp.]|nr:hypothetical protein [Ruminococcus sp.]